MEARTITPTGEQIAITDLIRSDTCNVIVNALAGTGKTTTLEMIQDASPTRPVLLICFNKRVADDATKRFPSTTTVRTFNSLGHRIWAKSVSKLTLDPQKTATIFKAIRDELPKPYRSEASELYWDVISAVAKAKALGYVPESKFPQARRLITAEELYASLDEKPSSLLAELIDAVLITSIKAAYAGSIDYNDQIFMPALFGGTFSRFPLVLVDEAQDLNPTNHAMLDKLCKSSRICAVGDPWQSIYGFRGAVQNGMSQLAATWHMHEKTISISFRCPQAIVENVRWRVPHFRWVKEGGHVEQLSGLEPNNIPDGATILCRNNAPLFRCAFHLLAERRSVAVSGSEIGPKLIGILRKIGSDADTQADLLTKIEGWRDEKLQKSQAPATINDMADCLRIFASFGATMAQAVAYAEHLFAQRGAIKMMTGHKAKGGEWDQVYHLDPWLIGDDEQELNLRYVISTRAKEALYEIDSQNIRWLA
jgi:DNA helicase-2/ATP-dependent DNA helicase PcrA